MFQEGNVNLGTEGLVGPIKEDCLEKARRMVVLKKQISNLGHEEHVLYRKNVQTWSSNCGMPRVFSAKASLPKFGRRGSSLYDLFSIFSNFNGAYVRRSIATANGFKDIRLFTMSMMRMSTNRTPYCSPNARNCSSNSQFYGSILFHVAQSTLTYL